MQHAAQISCFVAICATNPAMYEMTRSLNSDRCTMLGQTISSSLSAVCGISDKSYFLIRDASDIDGIDVSSPFV